MGFLQNADYTTGQIFDLADKLEQSETQLGRGGFMLGMETQDKKTEDKLAKATKDGWDAATLIIFAFFLFIFFSFVFLFCGRWIEVRFQPWCSP